MRRSLLLATASVLVFILVSPLLADDFMPPDFRGDQLTCTAVWEFTGEVTHYELWPDSVSCVGDGGFHSLFTALTHADYDTTTLFVNDAGYVYTDTLPSVIQITMNNWVDDYQFKHVWIQITYAGQGQPDVTSVIGADDSSQWGNPYPGEFMTRVDYDATHLAEYWRIQPNPNMDGIDILVPPFTRIDEIVVDTWSTDEPVRDEQRSWGDVKSLYR